MSQFLENIGGHFPVNLQSELSVRIIFVRLKQYFFLILSIITANAGAQSGGMGAFSVLKMPANAITSAWGGYAPAYRLGDATFMQNNPALLGSGCHKMVSMNFNTQFPGVWSGNGAYCMKYKNAGFFGVAFGYIDYGTMDAYDAGGNAEGQVIANESFFSMSYAKPLNKHIQYGASLKVVYSILAGYVANGIAADAGVVYTRPDSVLSAALVFRNAGIMFQHYLNGEREGMPFQAELGINFKPAHMPFRFNLVAHDLQKPDLTYNQYMKNSGTIDFNGKPTTPKEASFPNKVIRHLTIGTELVLGKNFGVLVGYNHQRRQEMAPEALKRLTGFSWGLHFKVSKIYITYSSAAYFPGYNTNLFTLAARLSDFKRKSPSSQPKQ